jgi:MFS family permease
VDPKWLLASALVGAITGMIALSVADNPIAIGLFVVGQGYGFGMCLFTTTMLLVNYYGPKAAPKTMGTMHLMTTAAMLGPVLGGYVADTSGSFAGVFQVYAVAMLICLVAVLAMQRPERRAAAAGAGE